MQTFCLGLRPYLICIEKSEELTNAQPDRDDPKNLHKFGLEIGPQFLDEHQAKDNFDYLVRMCPNCTPKNAASSSSARSYSLHR